jgi:hypothetical protein
MYIEANKESNSQARTRRRRSDRTRRTALVKANRLFDIPPKHTRTHKSVVPLSPKPRSLRECTCPRKPIGWGGCWGGGMGAGEEECSIKGLKSCITGEPLEWTKLCRASL